MSTQNYITDLLELKDNNIIFKENCYYKGKIKGVTCKIFEGYLSYELEFCPKCGVVFDDNFEKHGFIISNIKILRVSEFKTILRLHKHRYPNIAIKLLLFLHQLLIMVVTNLIILRIKSLLT